jgi:hypothetical protein
LKVQTPLYNSQSYGEKCHPYSAAILLAWLANFHKQQLVTAQQVNARSVTAGDYAALVSGLGRAGTFHHVILQSKHQWMTAGITLFCKSYTR